MTLPLPRRAIAAFLLLPCVAVAGGDYALGRVRVSSGAVTATGSGYALSATIAQPEASAPMTGDGYALTGGFRRTRAPAADALFRDQFESP